MNSPTRSRLTFVWIVLVSIVIVETAARVALGLKHVLLAETLSFTIAAVTLNSCARRRADLTDRARAGVVILSLAFVLGAIRAALWFAGLEVQWANLIILGIGLAMFTLWWRRRRRV